MINIHDVWGDINGTSAIKIGVHKPACKKLAASVAGRGETLDELRHVVEAKRPEADHVGEIVRLAQSCR